jgi:signal peptidase II
VKHKRVRIYDALALLTAAIVLILDQWTKAWVVTNLSPPYFGPRIPIIGDYLVLFYIKNSGAAFSLLSNNVILLLLIAVAIGLISYLYLRALNTGSLWYKLIFGLIIGGAIGNLLDRIRHSGYVIDFISFRIPQANFYFAIFNIADAAISTGVFLLFIALLFGGLNKQGRNPPNSQPMQGSNSALPTPTGNEVLQSSKEQDAQH